MDHKKRQRKQMRARHKGGMPIIGLLGVVLTGVALWDLSHQPASQVNGKKLVWTMVSLVQPVGPLIYLIFGRKHHAAS